MDPNSPPYAAAGSCSEFLQTLAGGTAIVTNVANPRCRFRSIREWLWDGQGADYLLRRRITSAMERMASRSRFFCE